MIEDIYKQMWQRFTDAMVQDTYQCDPYLSGQTDTRRGMTALAYIAKNSPELAQRIDEFLEHLRQYEPAQYYYPQHDLHVTLLSVISCVPGLCLQEINSEPYKQVFHQALDELGPIQIQFNGVTASPDGIVIQGYPVGDQLSVLRQRLRECIQSSGLRNSTDARYKLVTAHSTVMRFRQPLRDPRCLQAVCEQYRDFEFGTMNLTQCELVFNDWYQSRSETHSLTRHRLDTRSMVG